jgi:uncharacterized Zn finger protein (UPF0148 family)
MSKTTTPTLTAEQVATIKARIASGGLNTVPATAKSYICDACATITFNLPEDGDVLCDLCSPDAYHAAEAAEAAALAAAEHARIRAERDAEMSALIKAEAARRGLPPGRFTYLSC